MNTQDHDSLIQQLRAEARSIDAAPPPHLRRKVFETLARTQPAQALAHWVRWLLAGACAAALVVGAILTLRQHLTPPPSIVQPNPTPQTPRATGNLFASTNLPTLTNNLMDVPLERELQNLLDGLTHARKTIISPLPAGKKTSSTPPDPAGA